MNSRDYQLTSEIMVRLSDWQSNSKLYLFGPDNEALGIIDIYADVCAEFTAAEYLNEILDEMTELLPGHWNKDINPLRFDALIDAIKMLLEKWCMPEVDNWTYQLALEHAIASGKPLKFTT